VDLQQITPVILTFNESANVARTLAPLRWAQRIVVLDSGSSDNTIELCRQFANVQVYERPFDRHAEQWNYGLSVVQSEWVLALDADYVTDAAFAAELESTVVEPSTTAFFAEFIYCVFGRALRASLYPPRVVLFRHDHSHYVQDGHTQLLQFEGASGRLRTPIYHDDRKPLEQWLEAQNRYAELELEKLHRAAHPLGWRDSLRKWIFISPVLMPFYCLFGKGLIFDGTAGWFYCFQRTLAEMILSLRLLQEKLGLQRS
jgi:glycosyltransferase involved in cell wall biosynthesis